MAIGQKTEIKSHTLAYLQWGLGLVGICGVQRMYLGAPRKI